MMAIGERLRISRVQKRFSQSAMEGGTGLHACSVTRIENGYGVTGFETLERMDGVETRYESSFSRPLRRGWSKGAGSR
jgi:transcriptional regulator with XRE-family HTH domain